MEPCLKPVAVGFIKQLLFPNPPRWLWVLVPSPGVWGCSTRDARGEGHSCGTGGITEEGEKPSQ